MSRVLKGGADTAGSSLEAAPEAAGGRVIDRQVYDASVQAQHIIEKARQEASVLLERAGAVQEEARIAGYEAGREEGLASVTELLVQARQTTQRWLDDVESGIEQLAIAVAERILDRELSIRPEAVVDIVGAALAAARARGRIAVRVHPLDAAIVGAACPRLLETNSSLDGDAARSFAGISVRGDPTIPRGGCCLETDLGTIDARLATQLERIERALGEREQHGG
ncbi:MAG: type III secretion system stator protein SctL [Pseudomonadota bacterium]